MGCTSSKQKGQVSPVIDPKAGTTPQTQPTAEPQMSQMAKASNTISPITIDSQNDQSPTTKGDKPRSAGSGSDGRRDTGKALGSASDVSRSKGEIAPLDKPLMPAIRSGSGKPSSAPNAAVVGPQPQNIVVATATGLNNSFPDVPSLSKAAEPHRPVAFEIPLGDSLFGPATEGKPKPARSNGSINNTGRLPSLGGMMTETMQMKLANSDARWKVRAEIDRVLDGEMDQHEQDLKNLKTRRRRHGSKPELSSAARPKTREGGRPPRLTTSTPSLTSSLSPAEAEAADIALKQRLLEKEAQAQRNRARELEKLQNKLARMDEHVRRVQERKRELEREESEGGVEVESGSAVSLVV
ncbi:uncharacterized protein EV422DRAFT_610749 [Fimicolochytrium jonesii]|uniref:uncharacterized protein n=1 Tax=Fimicolochytrium jonesii TaxID=1396493 RepID=UPI0022FE3F2C|nr:uncharacterized protein EV422DRAFT_610749 [Fimicolochytrium jonesii]KAI8815822.1 hypothetical protein EV422DRAFT_610749 [Fimicolochytrium jonesii]